MTITIKTPISSEGELELKGHASLSSVMVFGAMVHTAKLDTQGGDLIQTDAEGARILANNADGAMDAICDGVGALGQILAYTETGEVEEQTLRELGWLLTALSEIGSQLQEARRLLRTAPPGFVNVTSRAWAVKVEANPRRAERRIRRPLRTTQTTPLRRGFRVCRSILGLARPCFTGAS